MTVPFNETLVYVSGIDSSGYSSAARNYILALSSIGVNVNLEQTIVSENLNNQGINQKDKEKFKKLSEKTIEKPYVKIHHCVPDKFYIDVDAELNLGYTVNETFDIPRRWVYMCNKMDAIFTASTFCKDVFENSGVKVPVFVVPHCLNKEKWNRKVKPLFFKNNIYEHRFLFANDTTDRKGIFELLEVWDSIPNTGNCSLTIKGYYNSFSRADQEKLKIKLKEYLKSKDRNPVFFYGHCLDTELVPNFIKSFDYLLSPSKGEGFGLLPFESIFLGVPPIVTSATGFLEYANEKNSILLQCEEQEIASDELCNVNPDYKNSKFIKINKSNLNEIITNVIDGKTDFTISNKDYEDFVNKFSYEPIAKKIVNFVKEVNQCKFCK